MRHAIVLLAVVAALTTALIVVPAPAPARALSIPSPVCTVAGWFSGLAGTICKGVKAGSELLSKGKGLISAGANVKRAAGVGAILLGVVLWVTRGSQAMLEILGHAVSSTTRPQLQSSWFSASYWRMAAIAMLLTIPFLLAACVQGLLRSDVALIGQAALGYLPLAVLAIMIATPVTALLLAASDELCGLISGAAGASPGAALSKLGIGSAATLLSGSSFVAMIVALITIAGGITLWIELVIREAAVYVIVLMLPVLFAAMVWPARRIWAVRGVEMLIALILSKFAIVAVLSLGASAIGQGALGGIRVIAGATLVLLAAFSPWAVLRLLPLHELAAGAAAWTPHLRYPLNSAFGTAAERSSGEAEGAPAVSPAGVRDSAHSLMAMLGRGGRGGRGAAEAASADGGSASGSGPVSSDGERIDLSGAREAAASGSVSPQASGDVGAPEPAYGPATVGGAPQPDAPQPAPDTGGQPVDPPPPEPYRHQPPSIRFGDDFGFGTPEPGGVAPTPIEDAPPDPPAPQPERDDPPLPPDDEHGTGPL